MTTQGFHACRFPLTILAAVALVCASALIFKGWMANSAEIFLTYAESGLSWCL